MIGGDGFVIYYNFIDYICHGSDLYLRGINYPDGEFIFLTDAHASFAVLFNLIQRLGVNVCEYSVGILHYTILVFLQIAAVVMYLLLKELRVNKWLAVFCSLLIVFLSPQMLRFYAGHFGLSFPFIIPFCLLMLMKEYNGNLSKKWLILSFISMVFFGLNNAYVGAIGCGLFIFGGGLIFLFGTRNRAKRSFASFMVGVLSLIIVFIVIKSGNHIDDRLEIQWGYFNYNTILGGFIYPEHSYIYTWLSTWIDVSKMPFHSNLYLGLIPILLLVFGCCYGIKKTISKLRGEAKLEISRHHLYLVGICVTFFLISVHFYTPECLNEIIEDRFSIIMMFKAISRFAWVSYFVLSIFAVLIFNELLNRAIARNIKLYVLLPIVLLTAWSIDGHRYMSKHLEKLEYFQNAFTGQEKKGVEKNIKEYQLNKSKYAAIYVVPPMQNWNDKIVQDGDFFSDYYSYLHAHYSQIPLINSQLSRAGLSNCLRSLQFSAHPLITKEIIEALDSSKKVLIVESLKEKRSYGEQALVDQSSLIDSFKHYNLRALDISKLDFPIYDTVCDVYANHNLDNVNQFWHYNNGFEDQSTSNGFLNTKAGLIEKGEHVILKKMLTEDGLNQEMEFSVWVYFDNKKYGTPTFDLMSLDQDGKELNRLSVGSRYVLQNFENWVRVSANFIIPSKARTLLIKTRCNQKYLMDELTIKPQDQVFIKTYPKPYFGYNNYPFNLSNCKE